MVGVRELEPLQKMIEKWREELNKPSGNLTTNQIMPKHLVDKLLEEDESLKEKLILKEVNFPKLNGLLNEIDGLDILAGLQKFTKDGCLTLFRAVRFPTYKRMYEVVYEKGYAISNFEQERILELYKNKEYSEKRDSIKNDPLFWTQPQERVVHGLPLFCLVNDALQIHRAYRAKEDKVAMIAIHIPHNLLESGKIKLISNPAIDLDYDNKERDLEIEDFYKENGTYEIDFRALRTRGIDLQEMYTKDLPWEVEEAEKLGVTQDFFLLDIYRISDNSKIQELKQNTEILKANCNFLHGFFGDQNIFGRRMSSYLPNKCYSIKRNEN